MAGERISLVLGSGGARGLAHIGVIRCLEKHGFHIGYLAGSSIGALIGGIYAAGKLDTYTDWVCALRRRDIVRLLDWSFRHGALFTGDRIIDELKKLVGELDIEDLPVGFTAVATELHDKREIWLNRGPLWDAVRASIAVPLVFRPVLHEGRVLVDGGLVNPVPIGPTLNDPATWTFAVDLNGHAERLGETAPGAGGEGVAGPLETGDGNDMAQDGRDEGEDDGRGGESEALGETAARERDGYWTLEQLRGRITAFVDSLMPATSVPIAEGPGLFDLALKSMEVMQTTIGRMKLAGYAPRAIVPIPRNLCGFFEFYRAKELIEFGYRRTEETLKREGL